MSNENIQAGVDIYSKRVSIEIQQCFEPESDAWERREYHYVATVWVDGTTRTRFFHYFVEALAWTAYAVSVITTRHNQ